ncbi:MAG: glycosyltransferase [Gammaproteobacteria bacterium]|nr:glycosyltransferase [Gammaproteobacteria bacterium]
MRLSLFDDVADGHHTAYLNGIVSAALDHGDYVVAASPEPIPGLDGKRGRWIRVPETRHRQVITGRRVLNRVIRLCASEQIDLFANLYLDKTIWTWPRNGARIARTIHVLHHAHHYLDDRRGLARLRTLSARKRLLSWVERGERVVVHTVRAYEILAEFLPKEMIVRIGYPVEAGSSTERHPHADGTSRSRQLLFVGQARVEKGAGVLLEALRCLPDDVEVTFIGPQNPSRRAELESRGGASRITWIDRYVSDAELAHSIDSAALVVLPYLDSFGRHGGASGALLDTLARGRPLVTTSVLAPQLPSDYEGAVVVEPDDARSLADGIMSGLSHLTELSRGAENQGPAFIRDQHSFEGYVRALLASDDS